MIGPSSCILAYAYHIEGRHQIQGIDDCRRSGLSSNKQVDRCLLFNPGFLQFVDERFKLQGLSTIVEAKVEYQLFDVIFFKRFQRPLFKYFERRHEKGTGTRAVIFFSFPAPAFIVLDIIDRLI